MKLPKMYRKKRADGRQTGSWRASVKGDDVNLGTSDAEEARKRLQLAVQRGRRNFTEDLDQAADLEGAAASSPPAAPAAAVPDAVIPPAPPPAPPPSLPPIPPSEPPPAAEDAAGMAAAAAEVGGGGEANDAAGDQQIPPDVLDGMLKQGALVLVDLQLQLQGAVIRRRLGKVPGAVPADSPVREMAAAAWVAQLKIWVPADAMLPPWAMALLLPALCIPVQVAGATEPPANQGPAAGEVVR